MFTQTKAILLILKLNKQSPKSGPELHLTEDTWWTTNKVVGDSVFSFPSTRAPPVGAQRQQTTIHVYSSRKGILINMYRKEFDWVNFRLMKTKGNIIPLRGKYNSTLRELLFRFCFFYFHDAPMLLYSFVAKVLISFFFHFDKVFSIKSCR